MNPSKLVHNPKAIHDAIHELPNGALVAKKGLKIYVPSQFAEKGLASIGLETYIVGIYGIVLDDLYYGYSTVNAMIRIQPTSTSRVMIQNVEYFEFWFEPGSVMMPSTDLVKVDTLVYRIYDEIISKVRIPWYLNYENLSGIFDTAKYHANANIGQDRKVTELILSFVARDPNDRTRYYRSVIKDLSDLKKYPPVYVPMRSVQYSASNTTARIGGNYFADGMNSALINPSDRVERIEGLLTR